MNYLIINTAVKAEILLQTDRAFYYSSAEKTMASAELLPRIEGMLKEARIAIPDIDVFGCVTGPGSFTGIRIGVSTARALCYALSKPAVAVTYFDVLTYNNTAPLTAIIDGGNGVCYLKNYRNEGAKKGKNAKEKDEPLCVRNEDIPKYACCDNFAADSRFTPLLENCRLAFDGYAALKAAFESAFKKGTIHYSQLIPLYLRRSQPEREAGEV